MLQKYLSEVENPPIYEILTQKKVSSLESMMLLIENGIELYKKDEKR